MVCQATESYLIQMLSVRRKRVSSMVSRDLNNQRHSGREHACRTSFATFMGQWGWCLLVPIHSTTKCHHYSNVYTGITCRRSFMDMFTEIFNPSWICLRESLTDSLVNDQPQHKSCMRLSRGQERQCCHKDDTYLLTRCLRHMGIVETCNICFHCIRQSLIVSQVR